MDLSVPLLPSIRSNIHQSYSLLKTHTHTKGSEHSKTGRTSDITLCTLHTQKHLLIISEWCHRTRLLWVKFELTNIVFKHADTHTHDATAFSSPLFGLFTAPFFQPPLVIWCGSQVQRWRMRTFAWSAASADKLEPAEYETMSSFPLPLNFMFVLLSLAR